MRRIATTTAVMLAALALAACGPTSLASQAADPSSSTPTSTAPTPVPGSPTPAASGSPITNPAGSSASGAGGSYPSAIALCHAALPTHGVVSGAWTTVDDLRTWGYGGPVQHRPLQNVFPAAASTDRAAWCWTKDGPETYTAWGVRSVAEVARAIAVTGPTSVIPSGRPTIP